MPDYKNLTWHQMADIYTELRKEAKRRNPIFINSYIPTFKAAEEMMREIAEVESKYPTSECGPGQEE
jgi:hypothetical protein